eukprot:4656329-Pleurochrysis_carterae.AAC.5
MMRAQKAPLGSERSRRQRRKAGGAKWRGGGEKEGEGIGEGVKGGGDSECVCVQREWGGKEGKEEGWEGREERGRRKEMSCWADRRITGREGTNK